MPAILITGASSGIGAALAKTYAEKGTTLYLTGRNSQRLENVKNMCRSRGAVVHIFCCDVLDAPPLRSWILLADTETPLDLVIANAGISGGTSLGHTHEGDMEQGLESEKKILETNVIGVLNTIHPIIPRMALRKQGHIAVISSLAGFLPLPSAPAYAASKAAIRFYTEALSSKLLPHNVHTSIICPGFIKSPMTEANEFSMPLLMETDDAAQYIAGKLAKKKPQISFPWSMYILLSLLSILPRTMVNYLTHSLPEKG
ncbi:MAG: SDR family NAD(P)-dependent oxidoreductase [Pseudobdellovibrionaceae bacterium]